MALIEKETDLSGLFFKVRRPNDSHDRIPDWVLKSATLVRDS